jgi:hypothetical protein
MVSGRASEVTDPAIRGKVKEQMLADRDGELWPGWDDDALFELGVQSCLLTLTRPDGGFPAGATAWRAPR